MSKKSRIFNKEIKYCFKGRTIKLKMRTSNTKKCNKVLLRGALVNFIYLEFWILERLTGSTANKTH